jgi:serine protease AprX
MRSWSFRTRLVRLLAAALPAGLLTLGLAGPATASTSPGVAVIVQGADQSTLVAAVTAVGGTVTMALPLVGGVAATVPSLAISTLEAESLLVTPDAPVAVDGGTYGGANPPNQVFRQATGATQLAAAGITGAGVTVAVVDTGIDPLPDFAGRLVGGVDLTGENNPFQDDYGHGTFVAGLIAGNGASSDGEYVGEAPGANLVSIKVAGASGISHVSTVIAGIGWAVDNAALYGIRVMNLSLGQLPWGPSELNPLDQAVEAAWNAGIAVVASAGNGGPNEGTIVAPGDDPLVITVGSLNDHGTVPTGDDSVPLFSAVGPTSSDGWLKPDLIAAGQSVVSLLAPGSTIATEYPSADVGTANFVGSGTSFSTAIVSGAVALIEQADGVLPPNAVKARLLATATPGPTGNALIEGHGDLDVYDAVNCPSVTMQQPYQQLLPPAAPGVVIPLVSSWAVSTWNAANYSAPVNSSSWDSSSWDSSSWDSSSWDSSSWDSSSWDSSSWDSSSWDSSSWDSSSWDSSSWDSSSWDSSSWGTS